MFQELRNHYCRHQLSAVTAAVTLQEGSFMQEVGIMQENVARIIAWGDMEQVIICQDKNVHCGHLSYIHSKDSSDI